MEFRNKIEVVAKIGYVNVIRSDYPTVMIVVCKLTKVLTYHI